VRRLFQRYAIVDLTLFAILVVLLTTTALPRLMEPPAQAVDFTVDDIAYRLSSASAINYAARHGSPRGGIRVMDCVDLVSLLDRGLDAGYAVKSRPLPVDRAGDCTLVSPTNQATLFTATGVE
jgi:hypothetical protein